MEVFPPDAPVQLHGGQPATVEAVMVGRGNAVSYKVWYRSGGTFTEVWVPASAVAGPARAEPLTFEFRWLSPQVALG